MSLIIVHALIALTATGLIYYFGGLYRDWWMFWTIPAMFVAFFLLCFSLWLITLFLCGLFVSSDENKIYPPNRFAQWVVRHTARVILLILGVRTHITGLGKVPTHQPLILIHNHLSVFDEFAISAFFPGHIVFISKPQNFDLPIAGPWMRYAGYIPIKQGDVASGTKTIAFSATYLTEKKVHVCVAPEGTRNKDFPDTLLLPFHAGTFNLAKDSGAPIVVLAIQNTNCIFKRFPRHFTHIYVDVVGVVEHEEYDSMTTREIADKTRGLIERRLVHKDARFYHFRPKKAKENDAEEK